MSFHEELNRQLRARDNIILDEVMSLLPDLVYKDDYVEYVNKFAQNMLRVLMMNREYIRRVDFDEARLALRFRDGDNARCWLEDISTDVLPLLRDIYTRNDIDVYDEAASAERYRGHRFS